MQAAQSEPEPPVSWVLESIAFSIGKWLLLL